MQCKNNFRIFFCGRTEVMARPGSKRNLKPRRTRRFTEEYPCEPSCSFVVKVFLDVLPEFRSRIFRIQLGQLPQDLLGALVPGHRHGELDLDDLVPASALLGGRGHTLFAQAKLLSGLGSRRNLEQSAPVDGWNLNLRSQRRFRGSHRNGDANIVAFAVKDGVVGGSDDHVEIAPRTAMRSGIAFARDAEALAIAGPGLDSNFKRFGTFDRSFPMTIGAGRDIFPRPVASWTGDIEFHPSASLRDLAFAAAFGAGTAGLNKAVAVAVRTGIPPGNIQAHHAAANGRPERHVDLIFKVRSGLGTLLGGPASPAEDAGENIAEAPRARGAGLSALGTFKHVGEIESAEIEVGALRASSRRDSRKSLARARSSRAAPGPGVGLGCSGVDVVGIKPDLIVDLPFLGIAQDFIGFREGFELLLCGLVPGIDVGMILARKFAKRLADIVRRGGLLHAENFVVIFFWGCGHSCLWSAAQELDEQIMAVQFGML